MAQSAVTLSFWFSDIEASTRMWEKHPEAMAEAVARHDAIVRRCVESNGGTIVKSTGDGLMAVFARPAGAVSAGIQTQRSLHEERWEQTGPLRIRT